MQAFEIEDKKSAPKVQNGTPVPVHDASPARDNGADDNDEEDEMGDVRYDPDQIISLRNVHKTYLLGVEGVTALRGVSFDVKEGEFVVILGTSGGGKTTLLNLMGTIDKPTKGDVYICGQKIKSSTKDRFLASLRLVHLGFVFQTFNLISSLTALENVELPMILRGTLSRQEARDRAIELLTQVGLRERVNHFPNQLSGGEQQRVTIMRALANDPKILLLDEPTGDLDTRNTDLVMKILLDLNTKRGITMVMVTHDVALKNYANRIVRIMDGKISGIETIDENVRRENLQALDDVVSERLAPEQAEKALGVRSGVNAGAPAQQSAAGAPLIIYDNAQQQQQQQQQKQKLQQPSAIASQDFLAQNPNTEVRRPNQYAVLQFSQRRRKGV